MAKRRRRTHRVALPPPPSPRTTPGLVSARRVVPAHIARPEYAITGEPNERTNRNVRTADEIARMRVAGQLAAEVLIAVGEAVRPGISTDELDRITHEETLARDGYPSPLNYRGFPKSVCTSLNDVICHGIPDSTKLVDGDIINIDVTVFHDGVHGDTNCTFLVGDVDPGSVALVHATYDATEAGIGAVRPGARINDIGRAIERSVDGTHYGIVREFIGHGIGPEFHTSLQIPHYYTASARMEIVENMTFTVEPMITVGPADLYMWDDDWTAVTVSGQRCAQFEHTLVVTADGCERLTVTADGRCAADQYIRTTVNG